MTIEDCSTLYAREVSETRVHGSVETIQLNCAAIDAEVTGAMEVYLTDAGLPVRLVQVTVGRANPPDAVKDQRVATATEQQRQLTEQQRKIAEDARLEAERSRAAADNAYRNSVGLSAGKGSSLLLVRRIRP